MKVRDNDANQNWKLIFRENAYKKDFLSLYLRDFTKLYLLHFLLKWLKFNLFPKEICLYKKESGGN